MLYNAVHNANHGGGKMVKMGKHRKKIILQVNLEKTLNPLRCFELKIIKYYLRTEKKHFIQCTIVMLRGSLKRNSDSTV
jgi:hypothetical protein